jgi:hypothetical protein
MLAASTVQVSAAGVLPWHTAQSMASRNRRHVIGGLARDEARGDLDVPLWQVWQVVTVIWV